jgi:hypothetical protein
MSCVCNVRGCAAITTFLCGPAVIAGNENGLGKKGRGLLGKASVGMNGLAGRREMDSG